MAAVGTTTVVLIRAPLVPSVRGGQLQRDWDNAVEYVITGCSVQPYALSEKLSVETLDNREHARSSVRVYAPSGSEMPESTDRARYAGITWEIWAFPDEWRDFEDRRHHIAFSMRHREG